MNDIAIRVDHLSKFYHLGRAQSRAGDSPRSQHHDTPSTRLRAAPLWGRTRLRDALVSALPRILRPGFAHGLQASPCGTGQVPRISRKGKDISSNSTEGLWQGDGGNSWQKSEDLWALRDVSFEACPESDRRVKQGEVVGIPSTRLRARPSGQSLWDRTGIGRNGAGKSTLPSTALRTRLKILSRITEPTSGRAEIRGRVASLLDASRGHRLPSRADRPREHPLRVNGATLCVGMHRTEIERKFDEIVAFAETPS